MRIVALEEHFTLPALGSKREQGGVGGARRAEWQATPGRRTGGVAAR